MIDSGDLPPGTPALNVVWRSGEEGLLQVFMVLACRFLDTEGFI